MNEILKTSDYDIFTSFTSNREVDPKHVAKLVRSLQVKNLLHLRPILVDTHMRIHDGQHRLEAAKILGIPIYYKVSDDITKEDISLLNSNQKNWSTMNYIDFYMLEGRVEFLKLSKFLNMNPNLQISVALTIISSKYTRNTTAIKQGGLDVDNIAFGQKVADALEILNKKYQLLWIYDSRFPVALGRAMQDDNFSLDTFMKKIDINPRAFVRCTTAKESCKMIEEIYNYRMRVNSVSL